MESLRLIEFGEHTEFAGFVELDKTATRIRSAGERRYIITAKQCENLKAKNIDYKVIQEL